MKFSNPMELTENQKRIIETDKISYIVGYFDNDEFWARAETRSLDEANDIRQSLPKDRTNLNDGLTTKYTIIKQTIKHEIL